MQSENQNENQINQKQNQMTQNQYQENFENFKKEEEFQGLLENLDIENIEIKLEIHTKQDQLNPEFIQSNNAIDIVLKDQPYEQEDIMNNKNFDIEIEKLLSDEDEQEFKEVSPETKQQSQSDND